MLATGGWRTDRRLASWMVRLPTRVLTLLAGRTLDAYVAKQLTTLRADRFEVVLHPSDLVLSGEEGVVVHARSLLAEQLAFGKAHLTWTRDARALEDHMRSLYRALAPHPAGESGRRPGALGPALDDVDSRLKDIDVTYEEWEVLFRQRLLLLLAAGDDGAPPGELRPIEGAGRRPPAGHGGEPGAFPVRNHGFRDRGSITFQGPHLRAGVSNLRHDGETVRGELQPVVSGPAVSSTYWTEYSTRGSPSQVISRYPRGGRALTIRIRLIVCSIDKAQEIGLDWWRHDPAFSGKRAFEADEIKKQLSELESKEGGVARGQRPRIRSLVVA